jgi:hypothetical protein
MNAVTQSSPMNLCFCCEYQEGQGMNKSVMGVGSTAGQTVPKTVKCTSQFDAAVHKHKLAMPSGLSRV